VLLLLPPASEPKRVLSLSTATNDDTLRSLARTSENAIQAKFAEFLIPGRWVNKGPGCAISGYRRARPAGDVISKAEGRARSHVEQRNGLRSTPKGDGVSSKEGGRAFSLGKEC
jgi:hypothetical protein